MNDINKDMINSAMNDLKKHIGLLPWELRERSERYYLSIMHLVFTMLGYNCRLDVHISNGRIDMIIETKSAVYCFEIKVGKSVDEALAYIDKRDYLLPWKYSGKKLFKVGVAFDPAKRNVGEWKTEEAYY